MKSPGRRPGGPEISRKSAGIIGPQDPRLGGKMRRKPPKNAPVRYGMPALQFAGRGWAPLPALQLFPGEDELKLSEDEVGRAARFLTPESAGGSSLNFSLI